MPDVPATTIPVISVRMYKGLLGDCFLLRLKTADASSSILIDCGILQGVQGASDRMKRVADDILATTGGRLDLLVATHEHADHLSGFGYAADVFFGGRLKIGAAWMAWTEDPNDPQAQGLRARFDKGKAAVTAAAASAGKLAGMNVKGAAEITAGLENFIGPIDDGLGIAGGPRTTGDILKAIKSAAETVSYLEPGQVLQTPGPVALRAYVLGPPRSEARLFKTLPSAGDSKETYMGGDGLSLADHLLALLDPQDGEGVGGADRPFPPRYNHDIPPAGQAAASPSPSALDPTGAWFERMYSAGPAWRRIDSDWLQGAGTLALKLDANTNNTSLVLAFETSDGDVLLFAADAQVGNWLSWNDQTYADPQDNTKVPKTVADLLPKVVLYKVGHHASNNATLDGQGLELMTHPALAAFIPVVEKDAHAQGSPPGWNMPFPPLLARLQKVTNQRVMRGDCLAGCDANGVALTVDAEFLSRAKDSADGLFVEYTLKAFSGSAET